MMKSSEYNANKISIIFY